MEPLTIAGLTVLALVGLVVEYHTRAISRGLAAAWRSATGAGPRVSADVAGPDGPGTGVGREPVEPIAMAGPDSRPPAAWRAWRRLDLRGPTTRMLSVCLSRAAESPWSTVSAGVGEAPLFMPGDEPRHAVPERPVPPPRPAATTHGAVVHIAATDSPTPGTAAEARASEDMRILVVHLETVDRDLARSGGWLAALEQNIEPLKAFAVAYDLDDLMAIPDRVLSDGVIAHRREVERTALELEKLLRDAPGIRAREDGAESLERGRIALRSTVTDQIIRGMRLAERLRRRSAGATAG